MRQLGCPTAIPNGSAAPGQPAVVRGVNQQGRSQACKHYREKKRTSMFKPSPPGQSQQWSHQRATKSQGPNISMGRYGPIRRPVLIILLLAMAAAGCGIIPSVRPTSLPTDTPTRPASPPLAHDYVSGEKRLPRGSYAFIEALLHDEGIGACEYAPSAEQPRLGYRVKSDMLEIAWEALDVGPLGGSRDRLAVLERAVRSVGFFGQSKTESISLGGATTKEMSIMEDLPATGYFPYRATDGPVVVEAVYETGAAVVKLRGNAYFVEPGARWQEVERYEPQTGCHVTRSIAVINHGLLFQSGLFFTDGG